MSVAVPTREPIELRAGTLSNWTRNIADYSYADGWRLAYYIRGTIGSLDLTTTADTDGIGFAASILTSQSTALPAGDYKMVGLVTLGADVREAYSGSLTVLPDFSTLTAGYDGRTHARKMLDSLQSAQLGSGGNRMVSYTIFGERAVTMMTPDQWQMEYAFWEDRVNWEKKGEALKRGENIGIGIRFR